MNAQEAIGNRKTVSCIPVLYCARLKYLYVGNPLHGSIRLQNGIWRSTCVIYVTSPTFLLWYPALSHFADRTILTGEDDCFVSLASYELCNRSESRDLILDGSESNRKRLSNWRKSRV